MKKKNVAQQLMHEHSETTSGFSTEDLDNLTAFFSLLIEIDDETKELNEANHQRP